MNDQKLPLGPCCFCAGDIAPSATDPCRVTVETAANRWEIWYCHGRCFYERLALRVESTTQTGAELR